MFVLILLDAATIVDLIDAELESWIFPLITI